MSKFDYIIVGAGSAGCVLAHRLSENPDISVALIEAGGSDKHPFISMPKGLAKIMSDPKRIWAYISNPEAGNAFKPDVWARGRLLGGSSSVNGMMYVRGQPSDFNEIAAQSSDDWSWKHIGKAYKALEKHELGANESRGDSGPLKVTLSEQKDAVTEGMIVAGEAMGLKRKEDVNSPDDDECIGYSSRTIFKGRRVSASSAFIDPIKTRSNLTIISDALVEKINFEDKRAISVSILHGDSDEAVVYQAEKEIILSAGTMATPGILQRSGIGPEELLSKLNIPVVHNSPEVGQNLLEHRGLNLQWKLNTSLSQNKEFAGWRLLKNVLRYYLFGKGPMASAAYELGAWFKSSPKVERPDVQFLMATYSFDLGTVPVQLEPFPGMNIIAYPLRPTSKGVINIKGTDPRELPELIPNYRATEEDKQLMLACVKLAREWAAQKALNQFIESETVPGIDKQTDDEIMAVFDQKGTCGFHSAGTCRMGADENSVVDPQLRVRGVTGLRVMDLSIVPQMPSGNTNGPVMAMAWRAADIILRD